MEIIYALSLIGGLLSAIEFGKRKNTIFWAFFGILFFGSVFSYYSQEPSPLFLVVLLHGVCFGSFSQEKA